MRKFVLNIIKLVVPFALLIVMVNYLVDPSNIFSNGTYETKAANIILKGHNIDNMRNCDERLFVENIVTQIPYKPEVIIIGTSRALEISSELFPNKKVLNCSVSHAIINDVIALIGLLDATGKLPQEIYIESSPTLVSISPTNEWFSLYKYYKFGIDKMKLTNIEEVKNDAFYRKIKAAFSFEYFQASFFSIFSKQKIALTDVGNLPPQNLGRLSDCSITYNASYSKPDTAKGMADAAIYIENNKVPQINEMYLSTLEQIIVYLKSKNVKVSLVNIPYQPDCYNLASSKSKVFNEIKKGILEFAEKNKVKLIGTLDPFEAHLNRSQFYDPLHCNKKALQSVFKIVHYDPYLNDTTLSSP